MSDSDHKPERDAWKAEALFHNERRQLANDERDEARARADELRGEVDEWVHAVKLTGPSTAHWGIERRHPWEAPDE